MITENEIRRRFEGITCWNSGGRRAPHKPLLLIAALARTARGESRLWAYSVGEDCIESRLRELLREFGTRADTRTGPHPEYPFWRLRNDEHLWEVTDAERIAANLTSWGNPNPTVLRRESVAGGFEDDVDRALRANPRLVDELTQTLLSNSFPPSLHDQILEAVGMPSRITGARTRDPLFTALILRIYEHRCAFCGFGGRLANATVGLDAAHVQWHAAGGPDREENGIALCVLHHRLFDRGALSLDDNHQILVSEHFAGLDEGSAAVTALAHRPIRAPINGRRRPTSSHLTWHRREVFRAPARAAA